MFVQLGVVVFTVFVSRGVKFCLSTRFDGCHRSTHKSFNTIVLMIKYSEIMVLFYRTIESASGGWSGGREKCLTRYQIFPTRLRVLCIYCSVCQVTVNTINKLTPTKSNKNFLNSLLYLMRQIVKNK